MSPVRPLPLGVDLGTSRVRIASAVRERTGAVRLVAVAARDVEPSLHESEDALAGVIEDLARELAASTRRAAIALVPSEAAVAHLRFPKMRWSERRRAAAFEAERFVPWSIKEVRTRVRVHAVDRGERLFAVGAARQAVVADRVRLLARAGLRVAGIDYAGYALRRAFPAADAVLDVGLRRAAIYAWGARGPLAIEFAGGGEAITNAIRTDLAVDAAIAEKRKRILGTAGAGDGARLAFAQNVATAIARLREATPVRRVTMSGNGARLCGLAAEIESASQTIVELAVSDLLRAGAYEDDVLRAAAPDWTLAAALATWGAAQ